MPSKRYHTIVDAALDLFVRKGFRATGIDAIVSAAAVSKQTLYVDFPNKDRLMAAAVERYSAQWCEWFFETVEERAETPVDRIGAFFDVLDAWSRDENFRGCLAARALAEFPEPSHPVHRAAQQHREAVGARLLGMIEKAGLRVPTRAKALADQLMLLATGAIDSAVAAPQARPARNAKAVAALLLAEAGLEGRDEIQR